MKTDQQLLEEYTEIINDDWKKLNRRACIKTAIETNNKEDSKRLRVALRRLVRNTKWTIEKCAYWPLFNHSTRPVTATMRGSVELYHFRENPQSFAILDVSFDPADEERTLLYLESIINAKKP